MNLSLTQDVDDCLRCAIATLFDLPLCEVPHFILQGDEWWRFFELWCQRLGVLPFYIENEMDDGSRWHPPGRHITVGRSPRDLHHAVVFDGEELLYDPHPSGAGLVEQRGVYLFHLLRNT